MQKIMHLGALAFAVAVSFVCANTFALSAGQPLPNADLLQKTELSFTAANPDQTFDMTLANLRTLFSRFHPATDSSSTIESPLVASGPEDHPTIKTKIRKCVFIICKTIDLIADVTARPRKGSCARDFMILADLRRSTDYLSDVYDRLDVYICLQPNGASGTKMKVVATAHQASSYETGVIQDTAYKFLKLQSPPMLDAIRKSLIANGASIK